MELERAPVMEKIIDLCKDPKQKKSVKQYFFNTVKSMLVPTLREEPEAPKPGDPDFQKWTGIPCPRLVSEQFPVKFLT